MNYGLYISAAGLQAQDARQSVIANNLANSMTNGFKRDLAVMRSRANAVVEDPHMRPYRVPVMDHQGGGVSIVGGGIDLSQASLDATGNRTDVALDGAGFFTVAGSPDGGDRLLTRNGKFIITDQGRLVTADDGRAVLDDAGRPITVNPNVPVLIDQKGTISQDGTEGVKLGIVGISDPNQLRKLGTNLLTVQSPDALTTADPATKVLQYHLEASGVDSMTEYISMMEGQRAFEANARMITYQDTTMSQLNTVGRVA